MQGLELLTSTISTRGDLDFEQAKEAANFLTLETIASDSKRDFLLALAEKGESAVEVAAFAEVFRDLALRPGVEKWADTAIDVCGTGGDGSGTFNISTAVSFILAAGGVPVFKHGNRSITSKCGSADLLEAFGVHLQASLETIQASLEELNFCFFFAPAFHPAFKEIMPVRKELAAGGKRTIFNLLGPLINPGRPAHQLMGVFDKQWVQPLASALHDLGLRRGMVVSGLPKANQALDELSCVGRNFYSGFGEFSGLSGELDPKDVGLQPCSFDALKGGDVAENSAIMKVLLSAEGSDRISSGLVDSILLNAGTAFWIAGKTDDLRSGVDFARDVICSGQVALWLNRVSVFYSDRQS